MGFWPTPGNSSRSFSALSINLKNKFLDLIRNGVGGRTEFYKIEISILQTHPDLKLYKRLEEDSLPFILETQRKLETTARKTIQNFRFFFVICSAQNDSELQDWIQISESKAPPTSWELVVMYRNQEIDKAELTPDHQGLRVGRWDAAYNIDLPLFKDAPHQFNFISRHAFNLYYLNANQWFIQTFAQGDCMYVLKEDRPIKLLSRKSRGLPISVAETIHLFPLGSENTSSEHITIRLIKKDVLEKV